MTHGSSATMPQRRSIRLTVVASGALVALLASVSGAAPPKPWWDGWSMADDRLSQPRYGVVVEPPLLLRMQDGVELEARVLRPRAPGVLSPAILHVSPYLPAGMPAAAIAPELQAEKYVERGYALVGVSVRGFGGSGGCADMHGPQDRQDMDQVLNAVARQPWSNGNLGVIGASWDGTSANLAAVTGNPHLRAVVPVSSIVDLWSWNYMGGVPAWYNGYSANVYSGPLLTATQALRGQPGPAALAGRPCSAAADAAAAQWQAATTGTRGTWWDQRDLRRLAPRVRPDLAVLQVAGARDENVRADQLPGWDRLLGRRLANYRLIHGNWQHAWPDSPDQVSPTDPSHHYNQHPLQSWDVLVLRWFERWLKGRPTGVERMPRALTQDGRGTWHAEEALQPGSARRLRLHPALGGALRPVVSSGSASWVDNGDNIDPARSCFYPLAVAPVGCVPVSQPNALFFTTAPLADAVRITGVGQASVSVSTDLPSGTVGVTLYDVAGSTWTPVTYGIASMGVRNDPYVFTPMSPGVSATVRVELLARDWTLLKGHRLGVGIGSQVGRNPRAVSTGGFQPVVPGGVNTISMGRGTFVDVWQATKTTPLRLR